MLFLSTGDVCCFLIGEHNKGKLLRPHSFRAVLPPLIDDQVGNQHRLQSLPSRLHAKKHEEDDAQVDLNAQSLAVNVTGSDPMGGARPPVAPVKTTQLGHWPCMDQLDKELIRISLPVIGNYAINPMIGAVDLFWVNRMGNALAVAGQAAANQVFSSAFWFTSFLPSGKIFLPHGTDQLRFPTNDGFFNTCSDCYTGVKAAR